MQAAITLRPVTYVTRADAAMFILKRRDPPIPPLLNEGRYPDVIENEWYTKYVIAGIEMGLWEPDLYSNRARPHKPITRGEFLHMLAVRFDLTLNQRHDYRDVPKGTWADPYAGIAAHYKLFLDERDPVRLRPDIPITHVEASKAYYTLLKYRPDLQPIQRLIIRKVVHRDTGGSRAVSDSADRNLLQSSRSFISRTAVQDALQSKQHSKISTAERVQIEVLSAINAIRVENGKTPLKLNKQLSAAAFSHAKDMYERQYFDHFSPDGDSYIDRIKLSGYTDVDPIACGCSDIRSTQTDTAVMMDQGQGFVAYESSMCECRANYALGENLAKGQLTVPEVVGDWMESPGHRANILQDEFSETGIGIFRDLWAQKFGDFVAEY